MDFNSTEIIFFLVVYAVGFFAATVRVVRDGDRNSIGSCLAVGLSGGLFSFGIICLWIGGDSDNVADPWLYVGVAALIGLLGKEQDKYLRQIMSNLMRVVTKTKDEGGDEDA